MKTILQHVKQGCVGLRADVLTNDFAHLYISRKKNCLRYAYFEISLQNVAVA